MSRPARRFKVNHIVDFVQMGYLFYLCGKRESKINAAFRNIQNREGLCVLCKKAEVRALGENHG